MLSFCVDWSGLNCRLGGQAILSLSYTEGLSADYDSGAAMCLAPDGAHAKGSIVAAIEGGVTTGYWCVEDSVTIRSGAQTWARNVATEEWGHIPLVKYTLRRSGWQLARATISRDTCPGQYPPRFCTKAYKSALASALGAKVTAAGTALGVANAGTDQAAKDAAQVAYTNAVAEYGKLSTRIDVDGPADIADIIAGWVGLSLSMFSTCTVMPDTYEPMGKTVMTALKEIAGWSGLSVYLDRFGVLQVYDYADAMGAGAIPEPAAVLSEEYHDSMYPTTQITVIGTGYAVTGAVAGGHWDWSTTPQTWVPDDPTADTIGGLGARAIEQSERWSAVEGDACVEQRIEIKDYPITEELAAKLAHEQMAAIVLEAGVCKRSGPADGCQGIHPLSTRVFSVTRTLEWADGGYRYEMTIEAPGSDMSAWSYGGSRGDAGNDQGTTPDSGTDWGNIPIDTLRGHPDPISNNTVAPHL